MRVMLSAAGSAVAPSIIRHLQSLGHYVIGHDCNMVGYGLSITHESFVSVPVNGDATYLREIEQRDFDVYLPFLDEELRLTALISKKSVVCSPEDTLRIFTNKKIAHLAFTQVGLPVIPEIESIVWKSAFSRGGKGVFFSPPFDGTIHPYIRGSEYTVDVLADIDGSFLYAVPRLRLQANGVSVIGKIVMDEEIIDLARLVVSKFKFAGPINIQVIRERDTGKLYIIELNPRLSGSCMFTVMAGFDILDATIKLWEGKPFAPPAKIDDGMIVRRHYVEERL